MAPDNKNHKVPQLSKAERKVIHSEPKDMDEALDNAQALIDEQGNSDANINKIRTFRDDVSSFQSRAKTIKEQLQEEIENTDEYDKVIEAETVLRVAKENLKRRLSSNSHYIELTEEFAEEKLSLRDAQANLSDFLLAYFADTKERQIELAPQNAYQVTIKAKLGKAIDFQTNIFSQGGNNETSTD
jgi:enamine deaminase RidA (YjgF/YER057c/UK114 family)